MQDFMLKKGIITNDELSLLMEETAVEPEPINNPSQSKKALVSKTPKKSAGNDSNDKNVTNLTSSTSEVTIYKKAVQQLTPEMSDQIDKFINEASLNAVNFTGEGRKVSISSEEFMDTSDELDVLNGQFSIPDPQEVANKPEKTLEGKADNMIRETEKSRAWLYDVPGMLNLANQDIQVMDNKYQMIDAHVDDSMKQKIINYEFVDLSKLLPKNKSWDDDHRLEIVNKNGMTFLSPSADRDNMQISSYNRSEQAFRIYRSILTTTYPEKSSELLQYNHTISTAAASYSWENVNAYDHEFRQHISWLDYVVERPNKA